VAIELCVRRLGLAWRRRLCVGVRLAALPMLGILAWQLVDSGINARRFGEASLALQLPYAPFYTILAAGMALYALVLVVEILLLWKGAHAALHFSEPESGK
jgi:TRAP-type C4-dicarboxylate transport system permease small subunit